MKNKIKNITIYLISTVYLAVSLNFTVFSHECSASKTTSYKLVKNDNDDCVCHSEQEEKHSHNCCETEKIVEITNLQKFNNNCCKLNFFNLGIKANYLFSSITETIELIKIVPFVDIYKIRPSKINYKIIVDNYQVISKKIKIPSSLQTFLSVFII